MDTAFRVNGEVSLILTPTRPIEKLMLDSMAADASKGVVYSLTEMTPGQFTLHARTVRTDSGENQSGS